MYIVTPIGWVGNKTSILKIIYAVFPLSYQKYIEPFGGSGAVLLGKPKPDKFEVYNDFNSDLVNLFRVMKTRPMALIRELGFYPLNSRDDFNLLKDFFKGEDITGKYLDEELELTEIMLEPLSANEIKRMRLEVAQSYDVRRAANYLKLLRYSYSSSGKSFGCRPFDIRKLFKIINNLGKRLAYTVIENQDFETLIKHYDSQQSFFYCDPPYYSSEYVYACQFTWEDHKRLADTLHSIKGKVLLSYNDCPEIRELYDDFYMFGFSRIHSMRQKYDAGSEFPELLVANYDIFEKARNAECQFSIFRDVEDEEEIKKLILKGEIQ